jgi:hypothetical protein
MEHHRAEPTPDERLHHELDKIGSKHAGGVLGLEFIDFEPNNPDVYYQKIEVTHVPVNETADFATIDLYANIAMGEKKPERFNQFVQGFRNRRDLVNQLRMDLNDGKNVALITNHGYLHDIPITQAALVRALNDESLIANGAIVISKLLTRYKALGMEHAVKILQNLGTTFFSLPRTKTFYKTTIDIDTAKDINTPMMQDLQTFMQPGGRLVALAPSGSLDEREYRRQKLIEIRLQRMSSGTTKLLTTFDRVLPVAVWLDAKTGQEWFSIGEITIIKNAADSERAMEWIAGEIERLARVPTQYEAQRLHGVEKLKDNAKRLKEMSKRAIQHTTEY